MNEVLKLINKYGTEGITVVMLDLIEEANLKDDAKAKFKEMAMALNGALTAALDESCRK